MPALPPPYAAFLLFEMLPCRLLFFAAASYARFRAMFRQRRFAARGFVFKMRLPPPPAQSDYHFISTTLRIVHYISHIDSAASHYITALFSPLH
jgi:hypothetical protein